MRPATVLYLVDGLGLSGKTKAMVDLVCGLDPARFRAEVACFDTEQSPLFGRLQRHGVKVHEIPCADGLNLRVLLRLGALIRRVRPAVVHCYNPRTMLYGGLAARTLGVRAVLGSLSAFACMVPDTEYGFLPQRLFTSSRRNRARNQIVSRLMRTLVTVSPSLGERFCRYNRIDVKRLRIVPYGVDVGRVAAIEAGDVAAFRARLDLPAGALLIGSVGRLVAQKDYPTQLRALALAARTTPRLFMVLAGDGPLRGEIEALVADLGIGDRVRFLGHCDEVPLLLRALDVFVLASRFEPYGVALLEAKAAGVTIVATQVNEIPEIISSGESGLLVPAEDPEAMASAFVSLANDAALRRRLGENAAREAVTRHSLQAAIDGYQTIYDSLRRAEGALDSPPDPVARSKVEDQPH